VQTSGRAATLDETLSTMWTVALRYVLGKPLTKTAYSDDLPAAGESSASLVGEVLSADAAALVAESSGTWRSAVDD